MSPLVILGLLSFTSGLGYFISLTPAMTFLPQFIAITLILFIFFQKYKLPIIYPISFVVSLIVFYSGGVISPFFFLTYFLLFIVAFNYHPAISLAFSLITILLLCQSLNSTLSLIPILSLIFITPLVWLVSRQGQIIIKDETDFLLWLNLKFKTGITTIIDSTSQLQSTPLSYTQKEHLRKVKDSAKSLLHSAQKFNDEI